MPVPKKSVRADPEDMGDCRAMPQASSSRKSSQVSMMVMPCMRRAYPSPKSKMNKVTRPVIRNQPPATGRK